LIFAGPIGGPFVNQKLDKGALFGSQFPWRRSLARPQPDDRTSDSDRLARPQFQIAREAVAFVEEAERGDAFRHWRSDLLGHRCDQVAIGCSNLALFGGLAGRTFIDIVVAEPATARQQQHCCQHRE